MNGRVTVPSSSAVAQYLPFLRRYARALTGSQAAVPVLVEGGRVAQIGWQGRSCLAQAPVAPASSGSPSLPKAEDA